MKTDVMKRVLTYLSVAVILGAFASSCRQMLPVEKGSGDASLRFSWQLGNARTIVPADIPLPATYDISVVSEPEGTYSYERTAVPDTYITVEDVRADTVKVTVVARDESGSAIASGSKTMDTADASETTTMIRLSYFAVSGAGSINLSLSFAPNVVPPSSVSATLVDQAGATVPSVLAGKGRRWTLTVGSVNAGMYDLFIEARTGNGTAKICESVIVVPTKETAATVSISLADLITPNYAGRVSDFVGPGARAIDGTGAAARFLDPITCEFDGTYAYIVDFYANTVRRLTVATGEVVTIAGSTGVSGTADGTGSAARFNGPCGITMYEGGLYVADTGNHAIRKLVLSGDTATVTTFAGRAGAPGKVSGPVLSARFQNPVGITADETAKKLYVSDSANNRIVSIDMSLSTPQSALFAGTGTSGNSDNADPKSATFSYPGYITAVDGQVYVTSSRMIRRIGTGGVITFAGSTTWGSADGIGTTATFQDPAGIASDGTSLYVADHGNGRIRKIDIVTAEVTTFAGGGDGTAGIDGVGVLANFESLNGIAYHDGRLVVCDSTRRLIRSIDTATASVTTLAGMAPYAYADGSAANARFMYPTGVTTDGLNLYVSDADSATIRKVSLSTGEVSTFAGVAGSIEPADGTGLSARFTYPMGIATDGESLFVADDTTIRKIDIASAAVTTLAGVPQTPGTSDGTGSSAMFTYVSAVTVSGEYLYAVDFCAIRKVSIATGEVTTLAGSVGESAFINGSATVARFLEPFGIAAGDGVLYVADRTAVRSVDMVTGTVKTFVGQTTNGTSDSPAKFLDLNGIATDGRFLYLSDSSRVRKVNLSNKAVSLVAGAPGANGVVNGLGLEARFYSVTGIVTDGSRLYVADSGNRSIRIIE